MAEDVFVQNRKAVEDIKQLENAPITAVKRNALFIGVVVLAVVFFAMFASAIISGVAAMITLVIAVVVLFYGAMLVRKADPLIRLKMRNIQIEMMYKEASENAVRHLKARVVENQNKLEASRDAHTKIGGQLKGLRDKLNGMDADSRYYSKQKEAVDIISNAYAQMGDNIKQAAKDFADFKKEVEHYVQYQKFAETADSLLSAINSDDSLGDMLSVAAFESISDRFNTSIVAIENMAQNAQLDRELKNA